MPVRHRSLGFGSFALATLLAVNSVLGPLLAGVIRYRYTPSYENQGIGLDAFSLAIAAPLLVVAGVMALRGHRAAPFLALGPALMAAYMAPQYVLGGHYLERAGNNERFFLLHLGLFVLGVAVASLAWAAGRETAVPEGTRRSRTAIGVLLLAVAGFLALRYLPALVAIWSGRIDAAYRNDPVAFWLIAFLDLGLVLPAALAAGVAILRGVAGARRAAYAIVGWFALVGPAVAAMGVAGLLRDDPLASAGGTLVFTLYGAAFALVAVALFRPLFRPAPR